MSESLPPDALADLLARATDALDDPQAPGRALVTARRRRTTRRAVGALGVTAVLAGALVVALNGRNTERTAPVAVPTTASATGTPTVTLAPVWDPRTVDRLAAAPAGTVPGLPARLELPRQAAELTDSPLPRAVLAARRGADGWLLGTDGSWRHVPLPDATSSLQVSPDGTRALTSNYESTDVRWYDLPSGTSRPLTGPADPTEVEVSWTLVDADTAVVNAWERRHWRVDLATGEATQLELSATHELWTTDPSGTLLEWAYNGEPSGFVDHAVDPTRVLDDSTIGRIDQLIATRDDLVATVIADEAWNKEVVLVDRTTRAVRARLPFKNPDDNYKGGLAVALGADDSVLLAVPVFGKQTGSRIVRWDSRSGDLSLVTTVPGDVAWQLASGVVAPLA